MDIALQMHNQNVVLKTLVSTIRRTVPVTLVRNRDPILTGVIVEDWRRCAEDKGYYYSLSICTNVIAIRRQ